MYRAGAHALTAMSSLPPLGFLLRLTLASMVLKPWPDSSGLSTSTAGLAAQDFLHLSAGVAKTTENVTDS